MSHRTSYTDRRRARLARRIDRLEAMESRNMVTESLNSLGLGIGIPAALAMLAATRPIMASPSSSSDAPKVYTADRLPAMLSFTAAPVAKAPAGESSGRESTEQVALKKAPAGDWLSLGQSNAKPALPPSSLDASATKPPQPGSGSGGSAGSSHGATVGTGAAAITPLQVPAPSQSQDSNSSTAIAPVFTGFAPASSPPATSGATVNPITTTSGTTVNPVTASGTDGGGIPLGIRTLSVLPENVALGQFTNFPVYTLDQNDGVVLFPGFQQLATLNAPVDLRAQVSGTTVSSYSWNTSGLTDATSITGSSTYRLQFNWDSTVATATTNTATLTVTGTGGAQEIQTYTFWVPAGSSSATITPPTWPESYPSNLQPMGTPLFAQDNTQNVSVDSNTGGVSAILPMPSYNPNIPGLVLSYDSLTAAPQPIIVEHHALDPSLTLPTQVSAQLTFNGTAGTTFYYNSSSLALGDVMQIAPQADATSLATGRYGYSLAIGDIRGTTTTTNATGTATVINDSGSALGDGWSVGDMEQVFPETGGAIVDASCPECGRTSSFWFTSGGGGTFTSPAGDFSTFVENMGGTYTRTLANGTQINCIRPAVPFWNPTIRGVDNLRPDSASVIREISRCRLAPRLISAGAAFSMISSAAA